MSLAARLLGLAFASADALVELDGKGVVAFVLGAGPTSGLNIAAAWQGKPFADLVVDAAPVHALSRLTPGARSDRIEVLIACGEGKARRAWVRAFILPERAPAVSLAVIYEGPVIDAVAAAPEPLLDAEDFMASASRALVEGRGEGKAYALTFLDLPGAGDDGADKAMARVRSVLQSASIPGMNAAQLTDERFALLRDAEDGRDIADEVRQAGAAEGFAFAPVCADAQVAPGTEPLCALRAMRFAIEGCLKDGGLQNPEMAFADSLKKTLRDADRFRGMVRTREFQLHYQPIVDLDVRAVHHFEALARFGPGGSPAAAIHLAEELALIEDFDLAVVEKALSKMRQPGFGLAKVAVNISGASLADDRYVQALLKMTAAKPEDRRRLSVEVTESAALADIEAADRRLSALRQAGIKVCIDDFGAGAASFDYLRRLSVDTVKIDGAFVENLQSEPKTRALLKSVVDLATSLNMTTIAERIETEAECAAVKALGVTHGQGWLFGKAEPEPRAAPAAAPVGGFARRRGAVESWG
ncbi:MAG: EAL domain-containing protein [Brevundimonas sp.]|uniref:EAL domain-containing protein n=1 Tax=Brevundimonas sp. TaxID=1871086 RepID=UPI00391DD0A5